MIVVDTAVWVSWLASHDTAHVRRLEEALDARGEIGLTPFILTEVLQGIRGDREFEATRALLVRLPSLQLDADGHVAAARIYRALRKRGITVRGTVDCLIAQTCLDHHAELLSPDRDYREIARHFPLRLCRV